MTHCFACEFARALVAAVALLLAIILVAAVCYGSENIVVMNHDPAHYTMSTRDFVIVLVAAVAAAVMVVVANSRGDRA